MLRFPKRPLTPALSQRERGCTDVALRHGNLGRSGIHSALVVDPLKPQTTRFGGDRKEGQVGIGRDGGIPVGSEHLGAVIRTREGMDNLARDELAVDIATMARFHGMRQQRFNFDDLFWLGSARDTHAWFCYTHSFSYPRLLQRRP